ncbi:hypothetical protein D3C87_1985740 [compost metagenome]
MMALHGMTVPSVSFRPSRVKVITGVAGPNARLRHLTTSQMAIAVMAPKNAIAPVLPRAFKVRAPKASVASSHTTAPAIRRLREK